MIRFDPLEAVEAGSAIVFWANALGRVVGGGPHGYEYDYSGRESGVVAELGWGCSREKSQTWGLATSRAGGKSM